MTRALVAALLLAAPSLAQAQSTASSRAETVRALANQPTFVNLRGGSLGIPALSGEASVSAQTALRLDGGAPALDLFAKLGNVELSERASLSLFAESARLDAPRAAFDPTAPAPPDPVPMIETQSFQSLGFRVRVRLSSDRRDAAGCLDALQALYSEQRLHGPVAPAAPSHCGALSASTPAEYAESYYRIRSRQMFGGPQLFVGARYLYRGAPAADIAASGAAAELGYLHQFDDAWRGFASASVTWLARAQTGAGASTAVMPEVLELRASAGVSWRPVFTPASSLTLGLQASLSWNRWHNDFARGAQDPDVHGRAVEASLFASGHLGANFNGLVSFGVLIPYGGDDGARFVVTLAPAASAATNTEEPTRAATPTATPPATPPPATPCPACPACPACPSAAEHGGH